MIAAVMGRSSNEADDVYSIGSQIDATLAYAQVTSLSVPPEYVFREDFSGRVLDRPQLNKIRALAREHKIQALVVYATDRLARRTGVGEILLDEFMENGVQLHIVQWGTYVKNTPEDRLRFNFETTFSSFERDKFMERGKRGKLKKVSMGHVVGNSKPPYGYKLNVTKTNFELTEYADIAREILILYGIDHMKNIDICALMEEKGYKTPGVVMYEMFMERYNVERELGVLTDVEYERKKRWAEKCRGYAKWGHQNVYKIMINHEFYAGHFTFSIFGEKHTVNVPAIITEEESREVQKALDLGRNRTARKRQTKHDFLMARRLRCDACHNTWSISYNDSGYCYYACSGKTPRAHRKCGTRPLRRDTVDNKAKDFIRELLLNPRRLFEWWEEQHEQEIAEGGELNAQIASMQKRIEQTTQKYHRTLDRLTDSLDGDEIAYYTQQRDSFKQLLVEYREELERLQSKESLGHASEEIVQDFISMGNEYRTVLETSEDFTFWRGLVEDLDITAITGEDGARRWIEFIVFGKTRKRFYLITEPSQGDAEQGKIDFSRRTTETLYCRRRAGAPGRRSPAVCAPAAAWWSAR